MWRARSCTQKNVSKWDDKDKRGFTLLPSQISYKRAISLPALAISGDAPDITLIGPLQVRLLRRRSWWGLWLCTNELEERCSCLAADAVNYLCGFTLDLQLSILFFPPYKTLMKMCNTVEWHDWARSCDFKWMFPVSLLQPGSNKKNLMQVPSFRGRCVLVSFCF